MATRHNNLWFIVLLPFFFIRPPFFLLRFIIRASYWRWRISRTCTTSGWSRVCSGLWSKTTFRKSSGTLFPARTNFPTWSRLSRLFGFSPRLFRRNVVPTWSRTGPPLSMSGSSGCWFLLLAKWLIQLITTVFFCLVTRKIKFAVFT